MKKSVNLNAVKGVIFITMAATLMGAQGCNEAQETRAFSRRVQLGRISAPPITLPPSVGNQQFNFGYVANQQMGAILSTTKTFSTANQSPGAEYTPQALAALINDDFQRCESVVGPVTNPIVTIQGGGDGSFTTFAGGMVASNSNSCANNLPQAVIGGSINDFSLIGGGGLSVGLANIPALTALNFSFTAYTLNLDLYAERPLDVGKYEFVSSIQNSNGYGGSLSATINFGALSLGPSGYYQTPLSTIVQNGLTSAVTELASRWSAQDPWYASIMKACDTYIYINGSSDLGLKVGDMVAVKNVTYLWDGGVCSSQSMGAVPDKDPVAFAQIVTLGDNISVAQVLKGNTLYPHANATVLAGSRVYMHQTAEDIEALQKTAKATSGVCSLPVGKCASSGKSSK